jgi:hypothetical protein
LRADIVRFRLHGTIIGVCEVQKPSISGNDLDNDHLRTHICNYMLRLRCTYGLLAVFGIVTTYNEWKICWLHEANTIAQSTTITSELFSSDESIFRDFEVLFESRVFTRQEPALIEALVSTLIKMSSSPLTPPTSYLHIKDDDPRKFGMVNSESFCWSALPNRIKRLSYQLCSSRVKIFFLVEDFHGGADGRVWLAITNQGKVAVIKLSQTSLFTHESVIWQEVWGVAAWTCTLLNCHALIMPVAFHASLIDGQVMFHPFGSWHLPLNKETTFDHPDFDAKFDPASVNRYLTNPFAAAKEALEKLYGKGYVHQDISWRHVALLPQAPCVEGSAWTVTPILIDCMSVKRIDEVSNSNQFISHSLCVLEVELEQSKNV